MEDKEIQSLIRSLDKEIKEVQNSAEKEAMLIRLQQVAKIYSGDDKVISSLDIAEDLAKNPPPPGIVSGFAGLDAIISGFTPKQLIVLSGITKHGKTSFAMELTIRMKEHNPVWLPFEEPAEELIQKILVRKQEVPLFFTPRRTTDRTVKWCEEKIIESIAKYGSKIVFIDHLGFITPHVGEKGNGAEEIGNVMRQLKDIAKTWGVIIVLLAHLSKVRLDKNPNLADLRGSAAIGQEADTVILIWRETKKAKDGQIEVLNNTNISVQANRRTGRTGNVKLVFNNGRFFEQDWQHTEDEVDTEVGGDW